MSTRATLRTPSLQAIARRFDRIALDQLRAECARLAVENEQLRDDLIYAEQAAEFWREDALRFQEQLCDETGGKPGLTIDGALVVVPPEGEGAATSGHGTHEPGTQGLGLDVVQPAVASQVVVEGRDAQALDNIFHCAIETGEGLIDLVEREFRDAREQVTEGSSPDLVLRSLLGPSADNLGRAGHRNDDAARSECERDALKSADQCAAAGDQADNRCDVAAAGVVPAAELVQPDVVPHVEDGLVDGSFVVLHDTTPIFGLEGAAAADCVLAAALCDLELAAASVSLDLDGATRSGSRVSPGPGIDDALARPSYPDREDPPKTDACPLEGSAP